MTIRSGHSRIDLGSGRGAGHRVVAVGTWRCPNMSALTFSEQTVLYNWERQFCQRSIPFLAALGVQRLHPGQIHRVGREAGLPHEWRVGWKEHGDKRHRTTIIFDGIDYSGGDDVEGVPIVYDLPDSSRGWSEVYKPKAIPIT